MGIVEEGGVLVELVHVALGGLVDVHFGGLFGEGFLLCLLSSSRFLISLLLCLDPLELFKDVLIMQESVCKLLLEDIVVQELANPVLNALHFKHLVDSWSLRSIPL